MSADTGETPETPPPPPDPPSAPESDSTSDAEQLSSNVDPPADPGGEAPPPAAEAEAEPAGQAAEVPAAESAETSEPSNGGSEVTEEESDAEQLSTATEGSSATEEPAGQGQELDEKTADPEPPANEGAQNPDPPAQGNEQSGTDAEETTTAGENTADDEAATREQTRTEAEPPAAGQQEGTETKAEDDVKAADDEATTADNTATDEETTTADDAAKREQTEADADEAATREQGQQAEGQPGTSPDETRDQELQRQEELDSGGGPPGPPGPDGPNGPDHVDEADRQRVEQEVEDPEQNGFDAMKLLNVVDDWYQGLGEVALEIANAPLAMVDSRPLFPDNPGPASAPRETTTDVEQPTQLQETEQPTQQVEQRDGADTKAEPPGETTRGDVPTEPDDRLDARQLQDWEANDYGYEHWDDAVASLSPEEKAAVHDYTQAGAYGESVCYREINGSLRGLESGSPQVDAHVRDIDSALDVKPVPEDLAVVRGVDADAFAQPLASLEGETIQDLGYLSTSIGQTPLFDKPVWVHLDVPEGTPALYVDKTSACPNERELLLGRGLSYRVDRIDDRVDDPDDGRFHIYATVLPPDQQRRTNP